MCLQRVVVDLREAAEAVSDRVLLQLRNNGFRRIELDLVAEDGSARRAVWTPAESRQMQEGAQTGGRNPCASAAEAHEQPEH